MPTRTLQDACKTQLRILQYKGRKAAIRLEAIFWSQLKEHAEDDGLTVSQLVFQLFNAELHQGNRTSLLRCYCLDRLRKRSSAEKLQVQNFDMLAMIAACPTPVAVITSERRLTAFNPAFSNIVSEMRGLSDGRAIQLSFSEPFVAIQGHLLEDPLKIRAYQIGIKVGEGQPKYFAARFALADRSKGLNSMILAFLESRAEKMPQLAQNAVTV